MRNAVLIRILMAITVAFVATPSIAASQPLLLQSSARTVQWHPGVAQAELQSAQIVRIAPGFHTADLSQLRDDQMIETPSGNRVAVRKLRFIQQAVAQSRAKTAVRRPGLFKILPPTFVPCAKPAPGETAAQILARRRPTSYAHPRARAFPSPSCG